MHLDKRRKYKICYGPGKSWCEQDGMMFTRGGYQIIDGVPVGIGENPVDEKASEYKPVEEKPVEESENLVCGVCGKEYKMEKHYLNHMATHDEE